VVVVVGLINRSLGREKRGKEENEIVHSLHALDGFIVFF